MPNEIDDNCWQCDIRWRWQITEYLCVEAYYGNILHLFDWRLFNRNELMTGGTAMTLHQVELEAKAAIERHYNYRREELQKMRESKVPNGATLTRSALEALIASAGEEAGGEDIEGDGSEESTE